MKYVSASTQTVNPFKAGAELGERLRLIEPELALVFCTIHYLDRLTDLVSGMREALGRDVLICGGTGDGIYETSRVVHHGACALGIRSDGATGWSAALECSVGADSRAATSRAAARAVQSLPGQAASLGFVLADGMRADGCEVVAGMQQSLGDLPFFGGLAGDDRRFQRSGVFLNDAVAQDAVMVLTGEGSMPFRLNAASGWKPTGEFARVTESEGTCVRRINNQPAEAFLRDQIGRTPEAMNVATVPFAEYPSDEGASFVLRSPRHTDPDTGAINLFGRIEPGARVRVCAASQQDIMAGVDEALSGVQDAEQQAGAVIVVSCACRKWLLTEAGREEVERAQLSLGGIPMVGIPSLGEIGPSRRPDGGYSQVQFHNVTFVVGVLGT